MTTKSLFIAFEGLDGSGQSTQANLLQQWLNSKQPTILTKENTDNVIGGLIRGVLTRQWTTSPEGLQLLFAADRAHHLHWKVEPSLKDGKTVITDRYYYSSIAYGGINVDMNWLKEVNDKFPEPNMTFFINVSPKECLKRIHNNRNITELFEKEKTLEKVRENYLALSRTSKNFYIIDGEKSIQDVHDTIKDIVEKHLRD